MSDINLVQTPNGGDLIVVGGQPQLTPGLNTAAYLSLFGGNVEDNGIGDNPKQWWGNVVEPNAASKLRSRTQHLIQSIPATAANLLKVEDAARGDLAWLVSARIVTQLTVTASIPALNQIRLAIEFAGDETVTFVENWKASL